MTLNKNLGRGKVSTDGPRVNGEIKSPKVRLIDGQGDMKGVVSLREALQYAYEAGLDLIEVSPNVDPPVCKILDHGKYKYEEQKRKNEARKKQKIIEIKEVKFRPVTEENDYQFKVRRIREFAEEGNKIKITIRFRGRELSHTELATNIMTRIKTELEDVAKVESPSRMEGRQMVMILAPLKS